MKMKLYWLCDLYEYNGEKRLELIYENGKTLDELINWLIDDIVDIMYNNMGSESEDTANRVAWAETIATLYDIEDVHKLTSYLWSRGWKLIEMEDF